MQKPTLKQILEKYPLIQLADSHDSAAILKLISETNMQAGSLQIGFDRGPDYFQFFKYQGDRSFVFTLINEDSHEMSGVCVITIKEILNPKGIPTTIAYGSDLRFHPKIHRRTRVQWRKWYTDVIQNHREIEEFKNCEAFFTAILDDNMMAKNSLASAASQNDYYYQSATPYEAYTCYGFLPFKKNYCKLGPPLKTDLKNFYSKRGEYGFSEWEIENFLKLSGKRWNEFVGVHSKDESSLLASGLWSEHRHARSLVIFQAPSRLKLQLKLLPLLGRPSLELGQPARIHSLNFLKFESSLGCHDKAKCLLKMLGHQFTYENTLKISERSHAFQFVVPKDFGVSEPLARSGLVFKKTQGTFYQVLSKSRNHTAIQEMNTCLPSFFNLSVA